MQDTKSRHSAIASLLIAFACGFVISLAAEPTITLTAFPKDRQLYPRDLTSNTADVIVAGFVDAKRVRATHLLVTREGAPWKTFQSAADATDKSARTLFRFEVRLPAELANFAFELTTIGVDGQITKQASAQKVVAGDVFVINGQSNAAAGLFSKPGEGAVDANDFVRSYGSMFKEGDPDRPWPDLDEWFVVQGDCRPFSQFTACAGRWGLRFGSKLVKAEQIPVAIINHARGGKAIDYFARNPDDANDPTTNYGTLLTRLQHGGLDQHIRAMLWYQGESDRTNPQGHMDGFTALFQDWQAAFPGIERTYIFQIRHSCVPKDQEFGQGSQISQFQRAFAQARNNVTAISTTALDGHDGCHFAYPEGYQQMGDNVCRIVRGELYDTSLSDADAPDLISAKLTGPRQLELTFTPGNTLVGEEGFEALFELIDHKTGKACPIEAGTVLKNKTVRLTLKEPAPKGSDLRLSYLSLPREQPWLTNASGIGILSFFEVPVDTGKKTP